MAEELNQGYSVLTLQGAKTWNDEDWNKWFLRRLQNMRTKRSEYDTKWDQYEAQNNAISYYDNDGMLNVNVPLEKTLKEIYMGRTEGKIPFDIIPDGQANVEELQPAKWAMNFFLDGNEKDNFWKENRNLRDNKSTYGSGIFFTGIRSYEDLRYTLKKDIKLDSQSDVLNEKNFDEVKHKTWFFFPKSIHPRDFFIDDAAYGQNDVQYAQDCIYKEKISRYEFEMRYSKNKSFKNVGEVIASIDINPKNQNDQSIEQNEIVLYHYYHRATKKYIINANEMKNIYIGRYLYNDGKLPFENIQHYTRTDRFWGEGIHERAAWLKAYQSEIWQSILSGAAMSSGINLLTDNDDQIGQDWTVGGRGLNIWRSTGGAETVQQINTSPNLTYFTQVLELLDKQSAIQTGINPLDQFDPGSDKVGIVEIMEGNKSVRNRSVDENYNIGLDGALTMMFSRVRQFAPALLCKKEYGEDKKTVLKVEFPMIRIDDHRIEKIAGRETFVESIGEYGYFELKPEKIQGLGVKITTPSTNAMLPTLERQKVKDYMESITNMANTFAMDPTGALMTKLNESINVEELIGWMNDAYGIDSNSLKASTDKDKLRKEITNKMDMLKDAIQLNPPSNATPPTGEIPGSPSISEPPVAPGAMGSLPGGTPAAPMGLPNPGAAAPMM